MPAIKITNIDLVMQQPALSTAFGFSNASVIPWLGFYQGAAPTKSDLSSIDISTFRQTDLLWSAAMTKAVESNPGIWTVGENVFLPAISFNVATWYLFGGKDKTGGAMHGVVIGDVSSLGQGGQFQINTVAFTNTNKYRASGLVVQFPYTFSY